MSKATKKNIAVVLFVSNMEYRSYKKHTLFGLDGFWCRAQHRHNTKTYITLNYILFSNY